MGVPSVAIGVIHDRFKNRLAPIMRLGQGDFFQMRYVRYTLVALFSFSKVMMRCHYLKTERSFEVRLILFVNDAEHHR